MTPEFLNFEENVCNIYDLDEPNVKTFERRKWRTTSIQDAFRAQ